MSGGALHGLSRECWGGWWSYMESDGRFGIELALPTLPLALPHGTPEQAEFQKEECH